MKNEKVKVVVVIEGGAVQEVRCGKFVDVIVLDYDANGIPDDELNHDDAGEPCELIRVDTNPLTDFDQRLFD